MATKKASPKKSQEAAKMDLSTLLEMAEEEANLYTSSRFQRVRNLIKQARKAIG